MEWISVKDRLPETATDCLVVLYFKDGGEKLVDIAHFSDGEFYTSMDGFFTKLTHWMPLPSLPDYDLIESEDFIKHGKWKLSEYEYDDCAKCSQCAVEFSLTGEWTFEDYLYYMHFCPNCGAKMDLEESE